MSDQELVMETNNNTAEETKITPEMAEIDVLKSELASMHDKYLRSVAEAENIKRRASLDMESATRSRAMSVAEKFLPLVDAINAAILISPNDEGLQTLVRASDSILKSLGISKIDSVGCVLNPAVHNAVTISDQGDAPSGTIVSELQSGYMFGDGVLRNAMVVVKK